MHQISLKLSIAHFALAFSLLAGCDRAPHQHSLAQARAAGFLAMQFNYVVSTNTLAVALYRKLGFAIVGTLPQAIRNRNLGLVDAYVMHRFL